MRYLESQEVISGDEIVLSLDELPEPLAFKVESIEGTSDQYPYLTFEGHRLMKAESRGPLNVQEAWIPATIRVFPNTEVLLANRSQEPIVQGQEWMRCPAEVLATRGPEWDPAKHPIVTVTIGAYNDLTRNVLVRDNASREEEIVPEGRFRKEYSRLYSEDFEGVKG